MAKKFMTWVGQRPTDHVAGRNPISLKPCHRALRGDGSRGGYHWGLTRK